MLDKKYYINNILSDKFEPKNSNNIEVFATFDRNSVQPNITTSEIEFVQEGAEYISRYIDNDVFGIFEMLPFRIELQQYDSTYIAFDGLIDLTDSLDREEGIVKVRLRDRFGLIELEDKAKAISWAYLYSKGVVRDSDFTTTGYVINDIPDGVKLALLALSTYIIAKETVESFKQTALGIKDATQETAGGLTGAVGAAIGLALEVILVLVYMTAMLIYIYKLAEELLAQIYNPTRYYKGMKFLTMMQRFAEFYNMTFSSTFLEGAYKDMVFLPIKRDKGNINATSTKFDRYGYPETGYGYNCSDIFVLLRDMFRSKYLIKGNTIYLESLDNKLFWEENSNYIMPNIEVLNKAYNTKELFANYIISFDTDDLDTNTVNNFTGTNYQVITETIQSPNRQNTAVMGLNEINLGVSRATRKTELTAIEKVLKSVFSLIDALSRIFRGRRSFASKIENRIGMMNLSQNNISKPKVYIADGVKISTTNDALLTAKTLYLNYHKDSSFVVGENQWELYRGVTIPFGFSDFIKCKEYGYFRTESGEEGRFDRISYNFNNDYAIVDYRIRKKYTNNLKEIHIEP